jgi:signal transduction histidine kinase
VTGRHRLHAARVALVATLVVAAVYAACAFGLGVYVNRRLNGAADARLEASLLHESAVVRAHPSSSALVSPETDGDPDDAPIFFWRVGANGVPRPLSIGAPSLPRQRWSGAPLTAKIGATPFRLAAVRVGSLWVVAGQNAASVARVDSALVLPEILFGLLVALATFTGAFVVGLRASAPLEVVRRRQAEFTADASHELRTPLSVVEAEVDLALRRRRSVDEYESVLRRIGAEGRRLHHIVEDLLWLARADNAASKAREVGQADVLAIVGDCVERFQAVAEQREVALTFRSKGNLRAAVHAAPEWIDRLAGVLIDNACKYAGDGGSVVVEVTVSTHRVVLSVDDSGPGIPPSERAAVLDRFHRATTEEGGSGLGLAIADSVVRLTDGTWSVEDGPLGGARMVVAWRRVASRQEALKDLGSVPPEPDVTPTHVTLL